MDRQIERYRGKRNNKDRGNSFARRPFNPETGTARLEERITKVKRFKIKAMMVTDAIDQMELLGHDFFLFFNADSEK